MLYRVIYKRFNADNDLKGALSKCCLSRVQLKHITLY